MGETTVDLYAQVKKVIDKAVLIDVSGITSWLPKWAIISSDDYLLEGKLMNIEVLEKIVIEKGLINNGSSD